MSIVYLSSYCAAIVTLYWAYCRIDDWLFIRRIERLIAEEKRRLEREEEERKDSTP